MFQEEKDVLRINDSLVAMPKSRTELINPSMEVTTISTDSRMELVVEMTLPTSSVQVPIEVIITKIEGTIGTFAVEALEGTSLSWP